MSQYDNSMKGVLFRNEKKTSPNQPDYKGQAEVNGVEVWLSAWIKTSKKGEKYMSLAFENKEGQVVGTASVPQDVPIDTSGFNQTALGAEDDIPF